MPGSGAVSGVPDILTEGTDFTACGILIAGAAGRIEHEYTAGDYRMIIPLLDCISI